MLKLRLSKSQGSKMPNPNTSTKPNSSNQGAFPGEYVRVRIPRKDRGEVIGILMEHFGSKLLVKCMDGFTRICRIPGKIRYKLHVNVGDVILIKKWEVQSNEKGDYAYKYSRAQIKQLLRKGFIKEEDLV